MVTGKKLLGGGFNSAHSTPKVPGWRVDFRVKSSAVPGAPTFSIV